MLVFVRTSVMICKLGQGEHMHVKMSDSFIMYVNKQYL